MGSLNHGIAYRFPAAWIVGDDNQHLLKYVSLPLQRSVKTDAKPLWELASRYIHIEGKKSRNDINHGIVGASAATSFVYKSGRHAILFQGVEKKWTEGGFIMKFLWSPWPESMERKFQIGGKIPERDIKRGRGRQHTQMVGQFDIRRIGKMHDENSQGPTTDLRVVNMDRGGDTFFFNMWHEALVPEVPLYNFRNKTIS